MDEQTSSVSEFVQLTGLTGIGAIIAGLFARFAWRKFAEEGTAAARTGGEADVIQVLRDEVGRLALLNASLSESVGELQQQVISLRTENGELKAEIQTLTIQLRQMRQQSDAANGSNGA